MRPLDGNRRAGRLVDGSVLGKDAAFDVIHGLSRSHRRARPLPFLDHERSLQTWGSRPAQMVRLTHSQPTAQLISRYLGLLRRRETAGVECDSHLFPDVASQSNSLIVCNRNFARIRHRKGCRRLRHAEYPVSALPATRKQFNLTCSRSALLEPQSSERNARDTATCLQCSGCSCDAALRDESNDIATKHVPGAPPG
jgi:hypothetical protein